jgi:ribosome-binding factor A
VLRRLPRLKRGVARALQAKHMPRLEFRRDVASAEQRAVEEVLERLAREREQR